MTELKNCPFCGSRALPSRSYSEVKQSFYAFIKCTRCGIRGRSFWSKSDPLENWSKNDAAQHATEAWNMRGGRIDTDEPKAPETGTQEATEEPLTMG